MSRYYLRSRAFEIGGEIDEVQAQIETTKAMWAAGLGQALAPMQERLRELEAEQIALFGQPMVLAAMPAPGSVSANSNHRIYQRNVVMHLVRDQGSQTDLNAMD